MVDVLKRFVWLHYGFFGRANRGHAWIYLFTAPFAVIAVGLLAALIAGLFGSGGEDAFLLASIFASVWTALAIVVKRSHDLGKGTLFITGAFIPFINLYVTIACLTLEGEKNENEHGLPSHGFLKNATVGAESDSARQLSDQ